jgi:hypothetical protein
MERDLPSAKRLMDGGDIEFGIVLTLDIRERFFQRGNLRWREGPEFTSTCGVDGRRAESEESGNGR